jgi:hypothetical protein
MRACNRFSRRLRAAKTKETDETALTSRMGKRIESKSDERSLERDGLEDGGGGRGIARPA